MRELWVFNEPGNPVVGELLAKGRELADRAGLQLCVVTVDLPEFQNDYFVDALFGLVRERQPEIFLFGATETGKTLAPSLAAKLETGLTADCTELQINKNGQLKMIRPAYGGNVLATVLCEKHRPQMATVRPGVFKPDLSWYGHPAREHGRDAHTTIAYEEITIKPDLSNVRKRMEKIHSLKKKADSKLYGAEFIVTGGRGMGSPENFQCLEELAEVLGGAVGASKAVVDIGWKQYEHQIGLSGKNVAPVVYIACGVSGAIQHQEGIRNADIIVAINSDPDAPIFDYADFGLVGDVLEVVPELIRQLRVRRRV